MLLALALAMSFALPQLPQHGWRGDLLQSAASVPGWAVFCLYLGARPDHRRALLVELVLIAVALRLLEHAIGPWGETATGLAGGAPLLATMAALARDARSAAGAGQRAAVWRLMLAASIPLTAMVLKEKALSATAVWLPIIYDFRLAMIDGLAGFQLSAAVAIVPQALPAVGVVLALTYVALPLVIGYVAGLEQRQARSQDLGLLPTVLMAGCFGLVSYAVLPAIGPKAYFGPDFPVLQTTLAALMARPIVDFDPLHVRNAMPSLHVSSAMLICSTCRTMGLRARILSAVFLALTAFATMALGEHYAIDLVVAVPFVLMLRGLTVSGLSRGSRERCVAIAAGGAMAASWLLFLRSHDPIPAPGLAIVLAAALTVVVGWRLEHHLRLAQLAAARPSPAALRAAASKTEESRLNSALRRPATCRARKRPSAEALRGC